MQCPRRAHEIEGAQLEGQRGRVGLDELDVRGCPLAALREQLRDDVDADHLAHERRERDRERTRARADVERALLTGQRQQTAQVFLRRSSPTILLARDQPGSLAESLPNSV